VTRSELATLFSEVVKDARLAAPDKPMSVEVMLFIELCMQRVEAATIAKNVMVAPVDEPDAV
jgi:hypothetical protein